MTSPITLHVCVTCRAPDNPEAESPGRVLTRAMEARGVRVTPVECMCVCTRPCTVAISQPGKWTYLIAGLHPENDVEALLEYTAAYAASPAGTPPLKERPQAIRRGTIARLPSMEN